MENILKRLFFHPLRAPWHGLMYCPKSNHEKMDTCTWVERSEPFMILCATQKFCPRTTPIADQ